MISTRLRRNGAIACSLTTLIFFIAGYFLQEQLITRKKQHLRTLLEKKLTVAPLFFANYKRKIIDLSKDQLTATILQASTTQNNQATTYAQTIASYFADVTYEHAMLIDMDGTIRYRSSILEETTYELKERNLATKLALATLSPQLSPFIVDSKTNKSLIYLVQPVIRNQKLLGVIALKINPAAMLATIKKTDVGRTGEVLLGHISPAAKTYLIPPSKPLEHLPHDPILFDASNGDIGVGVRNDYAQNKVVAAWDYVAETNIGIVIKQDAAEVVWLATLISYSSYLCGLLTLLLLLSLLITGTGRHALQTTGEIIYEAIITYKAFIVRLIVAVALGLSILLFFLLLYQYHEKKQVAEKLKQAKQVTHLQTIVQDLNRVFFQLEQAAQQCQEKKIDSPITIKNILKEILQTHPLASGVCLALKPSDMQQPYAPYFFRDDNKITEQQIEQFYAYTNKQVGAEFDSTWYTETLSINKPFWHVGSLNGIEQHRSIVYCLPLIDEAEQSPRGVIAVSYQLVNLAKKIETFELASTGKSIIISDDGTFIRHPEKNYTIERQRITDVIQPEGGTSDYQQLLTNYLPTIINDSAHTVTEKIPSTGWIIGASFPREEALRTIDFTRERIGSTVALILMVILFMFAIGRLWWQLQWLTIAVLYSLILFAGNASLWYTIYERPFTYPADQVVIEDPLLLDYLIQEQQRIAAEGGKKPYEPIRTGMSISSLASSLNRTINFTGFIWQRFPKTFTGDTTSNAISFAEMQELALQETARHQRNNELFVGWDVSGSNKQSYEVTGYPFVKQHIKMNVVQKEQEQNLMPIPDFNDYTISKANPYPWLEKNFTGLETSYFSYKKISEHKKIVNQLTLNAVLNTDLVQAFVGFILPLLVTLIAAFATYWVGLPFRFRAYPALGFAAVLVQRGLREKVPSEEMVYLELLIIFVYLTLLFLTSMTIINSSRDKKGLPLIGEADGKQPDKLSFRLMYWPVQLTVWFVTTAWFFM